MSTGFYTINEPAEVDSSQSVDDESDDLEMLKEAPTINENKRAKKKSKAVKKGGKRKKTSNAWDHFNEIAGDKDHAKCVYCRAQITCSAKNGTNAMSRHTDRCKKTPFNLDKKQSILDFESRTRVNNDGSVETVNIPRLWRFNYDEIRKACAKMIIIDELPFSFVEHEGFRMFCKIAIPDFIPPSRTTITRDCYGLFIEHRMKLKGFFQNLSSRVCLTTDTWTSAQNLSYMCLTAHFIDDDWKLHKRIINFCPVSGHSGELIGKSVEKCLLEWGLKRILTVTVDNASSNDLAIKYLKKILNLWDGCVLNSEFLHMRCAAHILNLVVKDGLKDVDISVLKVRAAVKYVRSSPSRLQKFKSCVDEEKITCKGLVCLDVETRWNSTYLMLRTAVVFRKAFKNMKTKYTPYARELARQVGDAPDDQDWNKIASFLPFLEIFHAATLKLSGSRYVTGNTFVEEIYDIGFTITKYLSDPNDGIKSMAKQMKLKYDKYWSNVHNVNILMFIALVLDPRNKLKYTEYVVRNSYDASNSYILIQKIRDSLNSLFDVYTKQMGSSSSPSTSTFHGEGDDVVEGRNLANVSRLRNSFVRDGGNEDTSNGKTELEKYLGDKIEPQIASFDILAWWAAQGKTYPVLMTMARDILAIPVSSVASESAFSTGGRVLDSFRTSLSTRMVEALVCGQDWMRQSNTPICIEEDLLELEKMEEGMKDLVLEQPTIIIDETLEVSDLTTA